MNRYTILGAAGAAFLALAGCTPGEEVITKTEADVQLDQTIPAAAPEAASGPIAPENSLNGVYNLRTTECGQAASEGALTVQGNKFQFYGGQCTAVKSTVGADFDRDRAVLQRRRRSGLQPSGQAAPVAGRDADGRKGHQPALLSLRGPGLSRTFTWSHEKRRRIAPPLPFWDWVR